MEQAELSYTARLPAGRFFLITANDGAEHVADKGYLPSSWGALTVPTACGLTVEAIGAANYSNRPCPACLGSGLSHYPEKDSLLVTHRGGSAGACTPAVCFWRKELC